jgi:hypothetical protein
MASAAFQLGLNLQDKFEETSKAAAEKREAEAVDHVSSEKAADSRVVDRANVKNVELAPNVVAPNVSGDGSGKESRSSAGKSLDIEV